MAGNYPSLQHGPLTREVNVVVTGGQLVDVDGTTGRVKPAAAASTTVLGVALNDAAPAGSGTQLNYGTNRPDVAVARGCECRVTYAANAAYGDKLVAAANGQVTPLGGTAAAADARQIVGQCTEPNGAAAGQVRRAWIL